MRKINTIPAILPDARLMAKYDESCREVEAALEGIRKELKAGGYDSGDMAVLSCAFVPSWIEEEELKKYSSAEGPMRELLESLALSKIAPMAARIDELRQDIARASFSHDGIGYALNLKAADIAPADGVLKVRPEHRQSFIDANTRRLTPEEAHAFEVYCKVIPQLQALRADGWHVLRILEPFCPRFDFQKPSENFDDLARLITTYRIPQPRNK
jgi:hypothetical protein